MGIDTEIDCKLLYTNDRHASAWLGIQLEFPRGGSNESEGFGQCHSYCSSSKTVVPTDKAAISVKFPSDVDFKADMVPELSSSRFPDSSYYALRVALKEGSKITVNGFGLPFSNPGHPSEGWLNEDKPIEGGITLQNLLGQRSFHLIVQSADAHSDLPSLLEKSRNIPFIYPYGNDHVWNADRYLRNMESWRGEQFQAAWSFDDDNTHLAVLTQSVVQDMLWAASDAAEIFAKKLPAYFVPLAAEDITYAIVPCGNDFTNRYRSAITRLTNQSFDIRISFYRNRRLIETPPFDEVSSWPEYAGAAWTYDARIIYKHSIPELKEHNVSVNDIVLRLDRMPPCADDSDDENDNRRRHSRCPPWNVYDNRSAADAAYAKNKESWNIISLLMDPHVEDSMRKVEAVCKFSPGSIDSQKNNCDPFRYQLHRHLLRGNGFFDILLGTKSIADAALEDNLNRQLKTLSIGNAVSSTRTVPPSVPIVNLLKLSPDYYDALITEIHADDRVRFTKYMSNRPLGLGIMIAGPGLGKTTAMAVGTLGMAETFGKVYTSAATHVAVDNFAARINLLDQRVVQRFNEANPDKPKRRRKLIIRGFKFDVEITAFRSFVGNPTNIDETYASPNAAESDSKWHLELSLTHWLLIALGSPAVRQLNATEDSQCLIDFRQGLPEGSAVELIKEIAENTMDRDKLEAALEDEYQQINKTLEELFISLLSHAEIVCTTPSLSYRKHFVEWRSARARAIVVDEAGNISRPDLYTVWDYELKPCLLGGDDRQLLPAVMTEHHKESRTKNKFFNRHPNDGKISPLAFFKRSGWPIYRLHTQFRMAEGLFDICQQSIYPDVPLQYGPGSNISLPQHKEGRDLEVYLQKKFPGLPKPPSSKLLPVFVHCVGSKCIDDDITSSKVNKDQIMEALEFIHGFVTEKGTDPSKIAIIAPYKANARLIERIRRRVAKYHALAPMSAASTVDSFQGKEREIVVVVMGTTVKSGPGFTRDKHRLNVMFSRQKSGLVVFGDHDVYRHTTKHLQVDGMFDELEVLRKMYGYFKTCGRLVTTKQG